MVRAMCKMYQNMSREEVAIEVWETMPPFFNSTRNTPVLNLLPRELIANNLRFLGGQQNNKRF